MDELRKVKPLRWRTISSGVLRNAQVPGICDSAIVIIIITPPRSRPRPLHLSSTTCCAPPPV